MINNKNKQFHYNSKYDCVVHSLNEDESNDLRKRTDKYRLYYKSPVSDKDKMLALKKKFLKDYSFEITDIIAEGKTDTIKTKTLTKFIPTTTINKHTNSLKEKDKAERNVVTKCFCGADIRTGLIIHEDLGSSWNCLLDSLGQPKYVVIYKIKKDE